VLIGAAWLTVMANGMNGYAFSADFCRIVKADARISSSTHDVRYEIVVFLESENEELYLGSVWLDCFDEALPVSSNTG
jgi:hypothetical protein